MRCIAVATVGLLLIAGGRAFGTVLTFDKESGTFSDEQVIPQDYGDNVAAAVQGGYAYGTDFGFTPNVAVDWHTGSGAVGSNAAFWTTGFGDLINVVEAEPEPNGSQFTLTVEAGFVVELHGFDMAGWNQATYTINAVRVRDGDDNILYELAPAVILGSGGTHTSFDFVVPLVAQVIKIEWDSSNLGGSSDNIGMDNIAFGQDVPEPGSAIVLTVLGGAVMFARRR